MNEFRKYGLVVLGIMCLVGTSLAGENPFNEAIVDSAAQTQDGAVIQPMVALQPGQKIVGTVDVSSSLNIRSGPWGDVIGSFGPGEKITIVGKLGDWYKVEHNGKTAFVHSAYVLGPGETKKPFPRTGWVNAPLGVNIRRVPHGDVLGTFKDQMGVEILGSAGDFYKIRYGDNEAFVSKKYIDTNVPANPEKDKVTPMNFTGFVSAEESLNVRKAPWGAIETSLPHGIAVQVTGKIDDWYRISFNGKERYVHANYIVKDKKDINTPSQPSTSQPGPIATGPLQERIANAARNLIGSKRFRGAEVDYGNKACAQVVSTALVNAGAMPAVTLNVRSLVSTLHKQGWKEVTAPPWQEGDVITWKTYDYTGDGVKDPDTHVGIMIKEGNSFKAMNNSSRLRTPRTTDPYSVGPVTRVMRKV
jgi:uncharacterized protein YgiM (DUF1202 family)